MKVTVLAFGIAKDIFENCTIEVELPEDATTLALKQSLEGRFIKLKQLASYMVAVNNEYSADHDQISEKDEIAIIPPVSGG